MPRLNPALLGMAALVAAILLSEPSDTEIAQATADSVQDAIKDARLVAMNKEQK